MSDQVGNQNVGFLKTRLKYCLIIEIYEGNQALPVHNPGLILHEPRCEKTGRRGF